MTQPGIEPLCLSIRSSAQVMLNAWRWKYSQLKRKKERKKERMWRKKKTMWRKKEIMQRKKERNDMKKERKKERKNERKKERKKWEKLYKKSVLLVCFSKFYWYLKHEISFDPWKNICQKIVSVRHSWHNSYHHRKWTQLSKFNS